MRIAFTAALALAAVAAVGAAGATAGGKGPGPGVIVGYEGVLSADGQSRLVAMPADSKTTVAKIRVGDGRVLLYATVTGSLGIPAVAFDGRPAGLSADGRRLVLAGFAPIPENGSSTEFTVVSTANLRVLDRILLDGSFSYDAVSPSGRYLFATEHLTSGAYRIRAVDLSTSRLLPKPIVDPKEPGAMQGTPVTRADGDAGRWAYTLYATGPGKHFIHALDTVARKAYCIDLPWSSATARAVHTVRMRTSARRLELFNQAQGRLATMDTKAFRVDSVAEPRA